MKILKSLIFFFVIIISISGCVASGNAPHLSGNPKYATVDGKSSFIELNDGRFIEGEISGNKDRGASWALIGGKGSATVGGQKYDYNSFVAIQEKEKYFRKFNNRFTERIVHGKINVYKQQFEGEGLKGRSVTHYQFYLQKGDVEKLVYFDLKTLTRMISDFKPAVTLMDEYNELSKAQKRKEGDYYLDRVIAKYNDQ